MDAINSEVGIANMALKLLGDDTITDFSDASDRARLMSVLYSTERDALLEEGTWTFATKRKSLAELDPAPVSMGISRSELPSDHGYALPNDYIRAIESDVEPWPYKIENGVLITDSTSVTLRYIFRQTDVTKYSPSFTNALACRLAWKAAIPLKGRADKAEYFAQMYSQAISIAKANDGQVSTMDAIISDDLLSIRNSFN